MRIDDYYIPESPNSNCRIAIPAVPRKIWKVQGEILDDNTVHLFISNRTTHKHSVVLHPANIENIKRVVAEYKAKCDALNAERDIIYKLLKDLNVEGIV